MMMNNKDRNRSWRRLGLLLGVLLVLAIPLVTALAASDQVRLTVDNRSPKPLQLLLTGAAQYNFRIDGEEKQVFAVNRGVYKYRVSGCGRKASGTIDLSINKTMVMPKCGASAGNLAKEPNTVDLGQVLKVVKIKVENLATGNGTVVLTGPSTYVFSLDKGETASYSVAKGEYKVKTYACGKVGTSTFEAYKDASLKIRCP